jgi:hypothetical protein
LVPIALVPFLAEDRRHIARAILPLRVIRPIGDPDRLADVELLASGEPARRGQQRVDRLLAAIRAGRAALVAERRGHGEVAGQWWGSCAREWAAIGDDDRATMARRYGRDSSQRAGVSGKLISDLVGLHPTQH